MAFPPRGTHTSTSHRPEFVHMLSHVRQQNPAISPADYDTLSEPDITAPLSPCCLPTYFTNSTCVYGVTAYGVYCLNSIAKPIRFPEKRETQAGITPHSIKSQIRGAARAQVR